MTTKKELQALLKSDLASFIQRTFQTVVPGEPYFDHWHIAAMAWYLQECAAGRSRRLIITLPPRNLKSIAVSVAFPAWLQGRDPTRKILCVSYAHDLSVSLAFQTRTVMDAAWYKGCFPGTRVHPKKDTQYEFMTTQGGYRLTTSVGGSLTGRGGNLIIIDDPCKAEDAYSDVKREAVNTWYRNTLLSRLDSKSEDVIILVQQRFHENDLAGYLLERGGWTHLDIPAIAEEEQRIPIGKNRYHLRQVRHVLHSKREPLEVLEQTQRDLGPYAFAAQYQQRPSPLGGGLFQWKWFKNFDGEPRKEGGKK